MKPNDRKTGVVLLELQRQRKRSGANPLRRGLAVGELEAASSAGNAVVIPFPALTADASGVRARQGLLTEASRHRDGLAASADDRGRWDEWGDSFGSATGFLERVPTSGGVALLAVQVCDYPSLKLLFGDRVAAGAVDLFELRLRDVVRNGDVVVRVSSVEFHVVLKACNDGRVAAEAAQRILNQCTGLYSLYGASISLSGNIGIALQPDGRDGFEELVQSARVALRESEEKGGNAYQFYTEEIVERLRRRARVAFELSGALEEDRLVLHYQPQYDMEQGRLVGFEALLRLRTRAGELWGPDCFIAHAEQNGSILPIGRWVLEQACRQLKRWQSMGQSGLVMAVNVSPRQLADERFPDIVEEVLAETGAAPADIELEITERQMVGADPMVQRTIEELHKRNLPLAVDDFGTGYSAFAYLASLPIRTVKLDRGFLANLTEDVRGQNLVRGLVKMLGELGLRFLAEGVETHDQERFLIEAGCPFGQGFGLGVPLSAEEAERGFSAG